MGEDGINLCEPIVLKVSASEDEVSSKDSRIIKSTNANSVSTVNIAIIIDDVINREPRFLQKQ